MQSRYYDPSICRFINSDLPEYAKLQKDDYAGTNLFAYCCNDAVNNSDPTGFISRINAAISIVIFVVFYIAEKVLKLSSKYKIECKKVIVDRMGNYIAKITYYKNKFNKKHFVLALGDKNSWNNAKNLSNHLNKDFINNQANYIQSEYNKGATTSLTNSGPNVYGVTIASASLAIYLLAKGIPTITIKKYYWLVWGDHNRYFSDRILYYLFNITDGGKKLNGWYLFRPSDGEVLKL
nr:hypothetical protein [Eubacteriales bacterium]